MWWKPKVSWLVKKMEMALSPTYYLGALLSHVLWTFSVYNLFVVKILSANQQRYISHFFCSICYGSYAEHKDCKAK